MGTPELDPFQYETLEFLDRCGGRAVVADPMGARKTGTVLAWLQTQGNPLDRRLDVLVVAPSSVHGHWQREAARFAYGFDFDKGMGSPADRHVALHRPIGGDSCGRIYITTYESMKQDQYALQGHGFDCVIFDEGHRLKGRRTQVALCANSIAAHAGPSLILLTGTPVINHAAEMWQYLHMLRPKTYRSFWRWVEEHYEIEERYFKANRFPTKIIHDFKPGHEQLVREEMQSFFIQRDIADLFPGQPWVAEPEHVEISVELRPGERKLYDNLVKHKWGITGKGKEITTTTGLDLTTRLNQITSDWGTLDEQLDEGSKCKATIELALDLLERDEPLVIFAKYKATVNRIADALYGHCSAVTYHGDLSLQVRDQNIEAFRTGEAWVIVGTLDSMSEGVDGLQARCANVIMVDRHWTPAKNDQAIGRVRRSGQQRKVTVYHVFAEQTLDATITAACLRKTNVIQILKDRPLVDAIYGRV